MSDATNYTYEKLGAAATYGGKKLGEALETPTGKTIVSKVDQILDTTEEYVDYYLPEDKPEGRQSSISGRESKPVVNILILRTCKIAQSSDSKNQKTPQINCIKKTSDVKTFYWSLYAMRLHWKWIRLDNGKDMSP